MKYSKSLVFLPTRGATNISFFVRYEKIEKYAHYNFSEFNTVSSDVLFCPINSPKPKDESHESHAAVFYLEKWPKWFTDCQKSFRLMFCRSSNRFSTILSPVSHVSALFSLLQQSSRGGLRGGGNNNEQLSSWLLVPRDMRPGCCIIQRGCTTTF